MKKMRMETIEVHENIAFPLMDYLSETWKHPDYRFAIAERKEYIIFTLHKDRANDARAFISGFLSGMRHSIEVFSE